MSGFGPNTLLLTVNGYERIADLEDTDLQYWNGREFVLGSVQRNTRSTQLVAVTTDTNMEVECHPEQVFSVRDRTAFATPYTNVPTDGLELGHSLERLPEAPVCLGGSIIFPHAYTHGFYMGSEKYIRRRLVLQRASLFGVRRPSMEYLDLDMEATSKHEFVFVDTIPEDFTVPLDPMYSLDTKLDWLAGLFDAGLAKRKMKPIPIWHYYSDSVDFLYQLKLLLQTLGVDSRFVKNDDAQAHMHYSLRIRARGMEVLRDLGLPSRVHRFETYSHMPVSNGPQGVHNSCVRSVEDSYKAAPTYTVIPSDTPTTNAVVNGIYVPIT
ncbi:MAG: LAGLIDADG family homing endonuclease [Cetobacterium sp.]